MKIVFIAYSHKDQVIARLVYHHLLKQRWKDTEIFMDEFSIKPGEDIHAKCIEKAKVADLGIVILSEHTQRSEYVPQEIGILLSREVPKIYIALHPDWKIPFGYEKTIKPFPLYDEKDPSEGFSKVTELVKSILNPEELGAVELINLATSLARQGKFDEALEYSEKAIREDPNYYLAHINKITNLRKLRRYDEALRAADEALAIFPNHVKILHYKAFLLYSLKNYREAINIFNRVLDLTGGLHQGAMYYKGRCLELSGNLDEAIEVFAACYKIDPTSQTGRDALQIGATLKAKIKKNT